MWIGAIKYLGFDVACAYKNGKLIWRPAELKLVDCNNVCIVTTPIFQLNSSDIYSLSNLKFNINLNSKSNLRNSNALYLTPQSITVLQENAALQVSNSWIRLFSYQNQLVYKTDIKIQNSILTQSKKQIVFDSQNKLLLSFAQNLQSFIKLRFINKIQTLLQPSNTINSKYGIQCQLFYKLLIQSSERIRFFLDITIKGTEKIAVLRSRLGIGEKNSKMYWSSQLFNCVAKQFTFKSNYAFNHFIELQGLMAVSQEYDIQHQLAAVTKIRLNNSNSGNIAKNILVKDSIKIYFSQGVDSQAKQNLQLKFFAEAISGYGIDSQVKQNLQLKFFAEAISGQGISSKIIYGIFLLDNSLMQLSVAKNEEARKEVEIIGKPILRNDKIFQISEKSLIYSKNGAVLFCGTSYIFNITNKNQIINYAFLNNSEILSIILNGKLSSCYVCTNLSIGTPDSVCGIAKQSLVICNSLNSIQPTYLLANNVIRVQTKSLLQLDIGLYYFADKKNPIKKIVQFNNCLNLDFLDYFLVMVEKNNLRYKNCLSMTEKMLLNNSIQSQLFYFAQMTLKQSKKSKYISNLLTKIKTSIVQAYKKDDLQLNNNNILWNYLKLTLSYFSEIFDYSSYFNSSSSVHGFATLTTDSWIYPKEQKTNLFIQQVYSYSHDTGEIT